MSGRVLGACLVAATFTLPSLARAAAPIVVAPTVTSGELNDAVVDQLEARLVEVLGKSELELVTLTDTLAAQARACTAGPCFAEVIRAADTRFLLVPEVALADEDYQLRLTLYSAGGAKLAELEETCNLCGLAEAVDLVGDLGARMGRKVELVSRASSVEIRSEPAGATVFIGDELVGTTPLELPLEPGAHPLRLELDGYIGLERTVEIVGGEAQELDLDLQPVPTVVEPPRDRRKLYGGLGWGSLVLGLGAAAGGVTLMVLDEDPITSDCSGSNVDVEGNCRWRYSTLEAGIGLAAGGAVLIGTGIALLVVGRKQARGDGSAARVKPRLGGLAVQF